MAGDGSKRESGIPDYRFNSDQQLALLEFIKHDLASLNRSDPLETSGRLFQGLRCHQCHDRDGVRSNRQRILAEEGSGKVPEIFPELTRAGERLRESWTEQLLAGKLTYKSRPWLTGRMPAFEAHSKVLARGLIGEHAVAVPQGTAKKYDPKLAAIGEKLTLKTGLDCRQCHGIGNLQPRGDEKTKVHLGINFSHIRDRLRYDAYERFMFDPVRYDPNSKMIKLSEDGITTKLKAYFDADAHQQFDAVWHYIQSLPPSESK